MADTTTSSQSPPPPPSPSSSDSMSPPACDLRSTRKSNKPLMEKRRRARINSCLTQLKQLVLQAMNKDTSQFSKLEKADILEMTVKHLKTLQRQHLAGSLVSDSATVTKYRLGFGECANEVQRYLSSVQGINDELRARVLTHLALCMQSVNNGSEPNASETPSTSELNLIPFPAQIQPMHPERGPIQETGTRTSFPTDLSQRSMLGGVPQLQQVALSHTSSPLLTMSLSSGPHLSLPITSVQQTPAEVALNPQMSITPSSLPQALFSSMLTSPYSVTSSTQCTPNHGNPVNNTTANLTSLTQVVPSLQSLGNNPVIQTSPVQLIPGTLPSGQLAFFVASPSTFQTPIHAIPVYTASAADSAESAAKVVMDLNANDVTLQPPTAELSPVVTSSVDSRGIVRTQNNHESEHRKLITNEHRTEYSLIITPLPSNAHTTDNVGIFTAPTTMKPECAQEISPNASTKDQETIPHRIIPIPTTNQRAAESNGHRHDVNHNHECEHAVVSCDPFFRPWQAS